MNKLLSGVTWNVCPAQAVLRGTCRWFSRSAGNTLQQRLQEIAHGIAQAYNLNVRIVFKRRYPATINNAKQARFARGVAKTIDLNVIEDIQPSMASEDFSFMLDEKAGAYIWLGAEKSGENPGLHHPKFDFNDDVLPTGANFWISLVKQTLC